MKTSKNYFTEGKSSVLFRTFYVANCLYIIMSVCLISIFLAVGMMKSINTKDGKIIKIERINEFEYEKVCFFFTTIS